LIEAKGYPTNDLLTPMFANAFSNWLEKYSELLEEYAESGKELGNDPHYDAVVKLLSVSVEENETNINLVVEKQLIDEIAAIIGYSNWEHDRYIPCLKLIGILSNHNDRAADMFMDEKIHVNLLKLIKESMM